MRRLLFLVAAAVLIVAWAFPASAYNTIKTGGGKEIRWNADMLPLKWYTHANRTKDSRGFAGESWENVYGAMRASFDAWDEVPCSVFGFSYQGGKDVGYGSMGVIDYDGANVMAWPDSASWPGEWSNAYAVTIPLYTTDTGTILDADMLFNPNFDWDTSGDGGTEAGDLQNIATHEIGHIFGLDHPPILDTTMYYASLFGETYKRTLAADDIQGICHLYPRAASLGSPCANDSACGSGKLCLAHAPSGTSVCSQACACTVDCPRPFSCQDGHCLPPLPEVGGIGSACSATLPCEGNGLCVSSLCSRYCTSESECPEGWGCTNLLGGGKACYKSGTAPVDSARALLAGFSASPSGTVTAATVVKLTAKPVSAASGILYAFSVSRDGGARSVFRDFSAQGSATYTVDESGSYVFRVEVKTNAAAGCVDDRRELTIVVDGEADGDTDGVDGDSSDRDTIDPDAEWPISVQDENGKAPSCRMGASNPAWFGVLGILIALALRRRRGYRG